jgi:nicotinate-nucleotide adenylyltransferase
MVRRAVEDNSLFRAVDVELQKGGVSYSIQTVSELVAAHPQHTFFYIVGGDMVDYLPKWNEIDELVRMVGFIGLSRPGSKADISQLPAHIADAVTMVEMPMIDVSSTWIRSRCAAGLSVRYLLPEKVHEYIRERQLYET